MTAIETTFDDRDIHSRSSRFLAPGLPGFLPAVAVRPAWELLAAFLVAAGCGAIVPHRTLAEQASVALVAGVVLAVVAAACRDALRWEVAWRTEYTLRAVAGGAVLAAAVAAAAALIGAAPPLHHLAVAALAGAGSLALVRPRRHDSIVDIRTSAFPAAQGAVLPPLCRVVKRSIDLLGAFVLSVLVLPVVAGLAVLIVAQSPGGWLFRQTRVGQNGRQFTLLKLRTMRADNDDSHHRAYVASLIARNECAEAGGLYKIASDPRITPAGRWIRKLSLDELPQLLNVLRGDMSLVGPRPSLPSEVAQYGDSARLRLRCKPGMTGLWQVSGRSRLGFAEMVELDVSYWQQWSLRQELSILRRTARAVFAADTA